MTRESDSRSVIDDLCEEEALVLGGLVAVHDVEDDFVWRLMRGLDTIRGKVLQRIERQGPSTGGRGEGFNPALRPHPAIEEFLRKLRAEATSSEAAGDCA